MEKMTIEQKAINTIRFLAVDAVQKANSGHPGTPMGLSPVAYFLWQKILRFDPENPDWPDRDRFILSCGHASMLLYSLLHLANVKDLSGQGNPAVSLDDIKNFRQLGSKCPGHPEHHITTGVETTTGPLGQGVANSVGMAIAERWMGSHFNRLNYNIFNFNIFALAGDGDIMEGITNEAASFAGHLKLSNLCWIYDDNRITIEGETKLAFSEDVEGKFTSLGWKVLNVPDANDLNSLEKAIEIFKNSNDAPTLIIVKSHIGFGSPNKQDKSSAHGEPLGEEEILLTKKKLGWPSEKTFLVPEEVLSHFKEGIGERGKTLYKKWTELFRDYKAKYPDLAEAFEQMHSGKLPQGWDKDIPFFKADSKGVATRSASGKVLNAIAKNIPWLIGGSADLGPSTKTTLTASDSSSFSSTNPGGRNLHFGVREHAMVAILNGMTLCGLRAFGSSFLIFSDYARGAIRLSSLMDLPVIHIYTHDSIGVGEDGPTHQPIEQIPSLRAIPGLITIRPADANEVSEAWRVIMELNSNPVMLILGRQDIPVFDRAIYASASGLQKGGYILADCPDASPDLILIGSGSEVSLCIEAFKILKSEGIKSRVVSLPSWELFERQDIKYKDSVLPPNVTARVSVEMASKFGWERYVGQRGEMVGIDTFGASAPLNALKEKFGFTPEHIVKAAKKQLGIDL